MLVEPEINEKRMKIAQKYKPDLRNEKIPNRTSIYEKLVEPLSQDAR